jgi:hypothetical protein
MQTLKVYPNPFAAFDKNGVPCGLCPRDPEADAGGPGHFVGARVDKTNTKVLQDFAAEYEKRWGKNLAAVLARNETRTPRQATFYEYMGLSSLDPNLADLLAARDPIELPVTRYYKDRLREGSLIPADRETAALAKMARFQEPADLLAHLQGNQHADEELPETPGAELLPQSPDAQGNVLEGPALSDGETREGVDAPADGSLTTLNPDAPAEAASTSKKRNRSEA